MLWDDCPAAVNSIFEDSYRTAVRTGVPVSFDAYYPAPLDGWYELRAWPSPDGLSVYFLEVTERRRVQEQAERSAPAAGAPGPGERRAGRHPGRRRRPTAHLPRLVVPALADFCIVTVVDARRAAPGRRLLARRPGAAAPLLERYAARAAGRHARRPRRVARALQQRRAGRASSGRDRASSCCRPGEARDLLGVLAPATAAVLPLRGRGRTLGLLTLYFRAGHTPPTRTTSPPPRTSPTGPAWRWTTPGSTAPSSSSPRGCSAACSPSRREPDHGEIAVRYLPAAEAARVGGDWYDAFLQPGGATMLVIGDVVGHDTEAAAAMGQLRGLLRGIATYSDAGPAEVLRGLDASMTTLQIDDRWPPPPSPASSRRRTSCERGITRMRWANAGHLPPLVVNPDGTVAELASWTRRPAARASTRPGRAAGVGGHPRPGRDGAALHRRADRAPRRRPRRRAWSGCGTPLDRARRPAAGGAAATSVLERLVDGRPEDDVALVAVRLHRQDRPRPAEAGPNDVPPNVPPDPASA